MQLTMNHKRIKKKGCVKVDTNALIKKWEDNMKKVDETDKKAKAEGKLVGRYICEPYADGSAIYKIVRENKNTVRIKVVTDIGDDWIIPYWGKEATIDKSYALMNINRRDAINQMFANRKL